MLYNRIVLLHRLYQLYQSARNRINSARILEYFMICVFKVRDNWIIYLIGSLLSSVLYSLYFKASQGFLQDSSIFISCELGLMLTVFGWNNILWQMKRLHVICAAADSNSCFLKPTQHQASISKAVLGLLFFFFKSYGIFLQCFSSLSESWKFAGSWALRRRGGLSLAVVGKEAHLILLGWM